MPAYSQTINGTSIYGVVKLYRPGVNSPQFTITLPPYNSKGLIETYTFRLIEHEVISIDPGTPKIETLQNILGYNVFFTCHYDQFITGDELYNKIKLIIDAAKAGYKIEFFPRSDKMQRFYQVLLANQTLELGVRKGGVNARGHRLPVLEFKTKRMETSLNWLPPDVYSSQIIGGSIDAPIVGTQQR